MSQPVSEIPVDMHPGVLRPQAYRPITTYILLGINLVMFLLVTLTDASSHPPLRAFLLRTFTGIGADRDLLLRFGASAGPLIRQGEYWRLIMPMFLHIGLVHFLVNNYALLVLGLLLERVYGFGRFALIYVSAGIASSFASMTFSHEVSAGASGAIFGIAGAMLVTGYLHREAVPRRWMRAFGAGMIPFIVLNLFMGYALRRWVDNWAHLGGLAGGMLLAAIIPPPRPDMIRDGTAEQQSLAIAMVSAAVVATAMFATLIHIRPASALTRLLVDGNALHAQHQDGKAIERYREAARLAPRDERPHDELGLLYLDQKHGDDAAREFQEALRLNPDSPIALAGLALAHRLKGDLAKAQQFESSLDAKFPTADGQLELAEFYTRYNFYVEAIRHYGKVLQMEPNQATAHNNLAWLYATADDPKYRNPGAALEHAQRAVELTQWKDARFIDTLAEALFANGNFAEAVKVQTKTLQLDPKNQEYQEHMARYRKAAGV